MKHEKYTFYLTTKTNYHEIMTECNICGEVFNKIKKKTHCPKCEFECCKHCLQTYILSRVDEPHCMNCKTQFNDEFLYENTNKTFMNQTYKNHKKQVLFDIETSRIPETMPHVEDHKFCEELKKKNKEIKEKIKSLRAEIYQLDSLKNRNDMEIWRIENGNSSSKEKETRNFVHKCPVDDCKGFLSTQWKCGVCSTWSCPHCFDIIGETKDTPHECKKEKY